MYLLAPFIVRAGEAVFSRLTFHPERELFVADRRLEGS